jgi:hypothetical protein
MGSHRKARHNAKLDIGHEGCGNQDPIDKIVDGIADHDQGPSGLMKMSLAMGLAVRCMAVPPEEELFKEEEPEDARKHGAEDQVFPAGAHLMHGIRQ